MSFNTCPICSAKAACKDSRQMSEYVRRNYICPNLHRYTTVEIVIDTTSNKSKHKYQAWKASCGLPADTLQRALDGLRSVLALLEKSP